MMNLVTYILATIKRNTSLNTGNYNSNLINIISFHNIESLVGKEASKIFTDKQTKPHYKIIIKHSRVVIYRIAFRGYLNEKS